MSHSYLRARVLHVIPGPLAGQHIVLPQFTKADPVAQRQLRRVGNLHARLQWRAHQGHAAKSPQGQATQAFAAIAVHQCDALASLQTLVRGHQAGQAAADDQHIGLLLCCQVRLLVVMAALCLCPAALCDANDSDL